MKSFLVRHVILVFACTSFFYLNAQLNNPRQIKYEWTTDTIIKTIELSEITVAVRRNTFPTIDYPDFLNKTEGLNAFFEHEPVISVAINNEAKAYPLNMLTMHEISNDMDQRLARSKFAPVSELCASMGTVVARILESPLTPRSRDMDLLGNLSNAIDRAFLGEKGEAPVARGISDAIRANA